MRWLEKHACQISGIFRLSGGHEEVKQLIDDLERGLRGGEERGGEGMVSLSFFSDFFFFDPFFCFCASFTGKLTEIPVGTDPHAVSGMFKQYLRDLPEPIFPFNLYQAFLTVEQKLPDRLAGGGGGNGRGGVLF